MECKNCEGQGVIPYQHKIILTTDMCRDGGIDLQFVGAVWDYGTEWIECPDCEGTGVEEKVNE